ncbi:hypothetical protein PHLCEN_2v3567 [Hermanssonia centrifuga]|uniref:Uncharacterized protein n=1 Tax=Hermanssonia centrifuga TaxID=98765 RepID=A0A2R6QEU0_9APHY|nr:hypothetical protein PHLCEN_2v3567 [Hermanssonia centrifuga]
MSVHLDPLWDYCLISPDTLSAHKLSTLAICQKEEIPEEVGEGWEVVKVLRRPLSIDEYEWSSILLEFHMVGQISREGCFVQTWHPSGRDPRTDILFRLERRPHDPAARIQWKKNIKKLQSALNHVQHLTESSIGTSTLFTEAAHPWDQKLCCIGMQLHNDPLDTVGYPIQNANEEQIMLANVSEIPFGVAVRVIFRLTCVKVPSIGNGLFAFARITFISFV